MLASRGQSSRCDNTRWQSACYLSAAERVAPPWCVPTRPSESDVLIRPPQDPDGVSQIPGSSVVTSALTPAAPPQLRDLQTPSGTNDQQQRLSRRDAAGCGYSPVTALFVRGAAAAGNKGVAGNPLVPGASQ